MGKQIVLNSRTLALNHYVYIKFTSEIQLRYLNNHKLFTIALILSGHPVQYTFAKLFFNNNQHSLFLGWPICCFPTDFCPYAALINKYT